jgi:hypothetical protein
MRFSGTVGFATSTETSPGVWADVITERPYFGNIVRDSRRLEGPAQVPPETNADIALGNSFSIVADAEAFNTYLKMRYVKWKGNYWTITNVEVSRPRLVLTIGGQWNGNKA